MKVSLVY